MGLDMYLRAKYYIDEEDEEFTIAGLTKYPLPTKLQICSHHFKISHIIIDVGYWRKANQIHYWFVKNIQNNNDDQNEYWVPRERLEKLLEICKKVLESKSKNLAKKLLPTQSGFFFGSNKYDDNYYFQVEKTIKILEKALKLPKKWEFYYSSWW